MNSCMTSSTWSRCTLRICAMATPTRCTSLGPMWRSTWAASVSPRDSKKIAALSILVSLALAATRVSVIAVDPFLHNLGHAARVFGHQALDRVELGVVAVVGARQQNRLAATEADPILGQIAAQATPH